MLLGTVLLLFQAAFPFFGAEARSKVIMLVVDALPVADFVSDELVHLRQVAAQGAIGLMSTRAAGPHTSAAAHVTIGAGARARAGSLSNLTRDAREKFRGVPVADLFQATTGAAPNDASVLFLGMAQLRALAASEPGTVTPGALGQALADAGVSAALIGNADEHDERRHAALIAMDAHGRVPYGTVGLGTLVDDPLWPFQRRTDYEAIWNEFVRIYDGADFIVIELGDLARLDAYANWLTPARLQELRAESLQRIDEFIGRLNDWPPAAGQQLLVLSPSPPADALRRGFLLAPVMWATLGAASVEAASAGAGTGPTPPPSSVHLVTSNTTRRAGIVTNIDIAPTVLHALGVESTHFAGTVLQSVPPAAVKQDVPPGTSPAADAWVAVKRLYDRTTLTNSLRAPVVRSFIGFSIAIFVAWIAWMTYAAVRGGVGGPELWAPWWRWVLLLLMAAPLAIFLLPLIQPQDATSALTALAVGAAGLTTLAHVFRRNDGTDAFVALALTTTAALVADVLLGSPLIKHSILGYDPIVAARFYGIGNEYMGVLIGTALIGTTGLLDGWGRRPRLGRTPMLILTTIVYAVIVVVLAAPSLGANVGGTIAAVIGFGTAIMLLSERRLTWKEVVGLLAAVIGVLTIAAVVDLTFNRARPSHLGRTLLAFLDEGWEPIAAIIARKLAMNLRLLQWTIWAQVFVVSLAISTVVLYRPGPAVQQADERHPHLLKGIRGAVIAALAALVANDSGVVAAATLMIPVTATLMYVLLLQRAEAATAPETTESPRRPQRDSRRLWGAGISIGSNRSRPTAENEPSLSELSATFWGVGAPERAENGDSERSCPQN